MRLPLCLECAYVLFMNPFIEEVRAAWGPLTTETVERCRLLLEELARTLSTPLAEDEELYRDPEHGFVLLAHQQQQDRYQIPHDHGRGWVIYAVVRGEVEMGTYARVAGNLVKREAYRMRPGDCRVYLPGDIHDTRCISSSAQILRFTSCDLRVEEQEGRLTRYQP